MVRCAITEYATDKRLGIARKTCTKICPDVPLITFVVMFGVEVRFRHTCARCPFHYLISVTRKHAFLSILCSVRLFQTVADSRVDSYSGPLSGPSYEYDGFGTGSNR